MKLKSLVAGAVLCVALPAMAGASIAPNGINEGQGEAKRAEQGQVLANNFCSFWEMLNGCITGTRPPLVNNGGRPPLRNDRLNQTTTQNSGDGSGRRDRGDEVCHRWKSGCRGIPNRGGTGRCWPRPESEGGGWWCPDG